MSDERLDLATALSLLRDKARATWLDWRWWRCRWFGHDWQDRKGGWRKCSKCRWISIPADAPEGAFAAALGIDIPPDLQSVRERRATPTPRPTMSRASSVEEIRERVEAVGEARYLDVDQVVDRKEDADFIFHAPQDIAYLLERRDELEALVVKAWEEGWRAGWDREPEKDAWRESNTRQALDTGGTDG